MLMRRVYEPIADMIAVVRNMGYQREKNAVECSQVGDLIKVRLCCGVCLMFQRDGKVAAGWAFKSGGRDRFLLEKRMESRRKRTPRKLLVGTQTLRPTSKRCLIVAGGTQPCFIHTKVDCGQLRRHRAMLKLPEHSFYCRSSAAPLRLL